jgi:hypothetical protein
MPHSGAAGVPIVANQQLLDAYSFLTRESVYLQAAAETEVDTMLRLLNSTVEDIWKARDAVLEVRSAVNCRAQHIIHKALLGKGLAPDAKSSIGVNGLCPMPAATKDMTAHVPVLVPALGDSSSSNSSSSSSSSSNSSSSSSSNAASEGQAPTPAAPTFYRRMMAGYQ